MTFNASESEDRAIPLIKKEAVPAPVPKRHLSSQYKAFRKLGQFLSYAVSAVEEKFGNEASRLIEGGVSKVEGESSIKIAEAKKIEAEAELIHAQVEEVNIKNALRVHDAIKSFSSPEKIAVAENRLLEALLNIVKKKGMVYMDEVD